MAPHLLVLLCILTVGILYIRMLAPMEESVRSAPTKGGVKQVKVTILSRLSFNPLLNSFYVKLIEAKVSAEQPDKEISAFSCMVVIF